MSSQRSPATRGEVVVNLPIADSTDPVGTKPEAAQPPAPVPAAAVKARGVALTILATAAAILLLRYMQPVLIPFVLAGLMFYALDPFVDGLQKVHIPRPLGAGLVMAALVAGLAGTAYVVQDDMFAIVEELPAAARKIRSILARADEEPTTLDKLQQAATELEQTAEEAAGPQQAPPREVTRVQVEEPAFRAADYVWWSSLGALGLLGQAALILFLSYFLLVYDDLFKRKLVEIIGPTLTNKKTAVQILNDIAGQIERFLMVQIATSALVAVVTALALSWVGLRQPLIWGLAAGVLNSIPYFGPLIVTGALALVAFVQFGTISGAAGVAAIALLITSLEGWLLTPHLMGRVAEMNRIAIFAGLLFWSWLWGIPGMLLAVPIMMIVKAVCDHVEELEPIGKLLGD